MPSTLVRHFLDYYRTLEPPEQSALADAQTLWGTRTISGSVVADLARPDVALGLRENRVRASWLNDMTNGKHRDPYRYSSVPDLRAYCAMATMRHRSGDQPPTEWHRMMDEYASSVKGAKAPALRKLVRELVRRRFGGRAAKGSGRGWTYERAGGESHFFFAIDWGGNYAQLRYNAVITTGTGILNVTRGLEGALGAGHGDWDYLTEANAAACIELLGDVIEDLSRWPARLAVAMQQ